MNKNLAAPADRTRRGPQPKPIDAKKPKNKRQEMLEAAAQVKGLAELLDSLSTILNVSSRV